jgi:hypothetical protein
VAVAKLFGHGGLQVEHQPVFAPAGGRVQAGADQAEQGLVALSCWPRNAWQAAGPARPAAAQAGGLGHPEDGVQIAQAAGRFLAVGLQRVGRVLVLGVALAHLQRLGLKRPRVELRAKRCSNLANRACCRDAARSSRRSAPSRRRGLLQAFGRCARWSRFPARVPATADELLELGLAGLSSPAGCSGSSTSTSTSE